jgi:protein phosphatase
MSTLHIHPAGATDIGNVRETNEDHFLAEGDLVAVADGMGGHGRGQIASRVAIEALQRAFAADPSATGLVEAVRRANTAVVELADPDPDGPGIGTTIAAVARVGGADDDRLVVVNVGDTRVYLHRAGVLTRLSDDHSLVADLVRAGEITEEEAAGHPERHVLTLALGVERSVVPAVNHARPRPGDRVLVCSDGLFNELSPERIAATLTDVGAAEAAVEALVAEAKANGGADNITVVVLDVR